MDATLDDILFKAESKSQYLSQHPGIVIPLKQRVSFWNKARRIPMEKQAYYGPRSDGFIIEEEIVTDDTANIKVNSRKRSLMQPATVKAIKKMKKVV